ncbi:MAG: ABC transporter ATP-binding protein [Pirellulales bacterium]|nr:ABC transporter ATP-binding protein [Pirellulales bacterium]
MSAVIRMDRVCKRFRRQIALDQVSLDVPPGVIFALLGENGAGKTTAIRILLGLAEADSGDSQVLGLSSRRQAIEIRRRVGYVPERPTLYDWMTVAEIGWFAAGFYPDGYLQRYLQIVRQFDLPERRKVRALSKGMRAKVSLSLAMAHEPDLLVLDEPTSGLDTLVRREFLESMIERAASGQTVLLSSHQIGEVERVADVVAILREGQLLLVERLDALKSQVREVTLTLVNGALPSLDIPGEVLAQRRRPRQWQLLVRGLAEQELSAFQSDPAVHSVEARSPSLEEIFVAYMEHRASENGHTVAEVPVP